MLEPIHCKTVSWDSLELPSQDSRSRPAPASPHWQNPYPAASQRSCYDWSLHRSVQTRRACANTGCNPSGAPVLSSVRSYRPNFSAVILLSGAVSAIAASAQTPIPANDSNNPPLPPPEIPYLLHVTTREVLVEVIAVDSRNQPVVDLTPADLQVVERISNSPDVPVSISSLRLIDPTAADPGRSSNQSPFCGS